MFGEQFIRDSINKSIKVRSLLRVGEVLLGAEELRNPQIQPGWQLSRGKRTVTLVFKNEEGAFLRQDDEKESQLVFISFRRHYYLYDDKYGTRREITRDEVLEILGREYSDAEYVFENVLVEKGGLRTTYKTIRIVNE